MSGWKRTVRWTDWEEKGLEHLSISETANGFQANSVVIGERGGTPYGLHYQLSLDSRWIARALDTHLMDGPSLHVTSNGKGSWYDGDAKEIEELSGCIDVDIAATPFTNTLPIRRLGLKVGESSDISVAYVPLPTLSMEAVEQRYTKLSEDHFLYEGIFRGFSAELPVDRDGIVIDYPETFKRVV